MATSLIPPHRRVSSLGATAPTTIGEESRPAGITIYAEIDLHITDKFPTPPKKETAIYLPDGFSDDDGNVDILIYFHGMKINGDPHMTIDTYLKHDFGLLREKVLGSGLNVALIAPTLGFDSEAQGLDEHGGFDGFLGQVLAAIRDRIHPQHASELFLRNLVLSCHSAGGKRMHKIASGSDDALANLQECWGFDCMYEETDPEFWKTWAKQRTADKCYVYYQSSTELNSLALKKANLTNLIVQQSAAPDHMHVPITHFPVRLTGAKFLNPRSAAEIVAETSNINGDNNS